ncbi:MAG: hypothetical protein VR64_09780 [Desulfatitalea sp. BRH_c12]|nr:MAG: hypothetical protein VR64_09780 [Desulfatitalea sp. BRH_c12]
MPVAIDCYRQDTDWFENRFYEKSKMKNAIKLRWILAALTMTVGVALRTPSLATNYDIVGEVNDNYQLVTAGQIYEIADTAAGNDMAENHMNTQVKISGTVEERDDMKIITVISYTILAK